MGRSSTRTYNKFHFWAAADCVCELCQFYSTKNKSCTLDACCIEDIKQEAIQREQTANELSNISVQMCDTALSGEGGAA